MIENGVMNLVNLPGFTEVMKSMAFAMGLSVIMMTGYRICNHTLSYNPRFNVMLFMLCVASTALMILVKEHPLFSLGALGTLSICRIRMNTRDPRDLGFVFWSIAIGISSAMQAFQIGLLSSILLIGILAGARLFHRSEQSAHLIIRGERGRLEDILRRLKGKRGYRMESETVFQDRFELVYRLNNASGEKSLFAEEISRLEGIDGADLMAPKTMLV